MRAPDAGHSGQDPEARLADTFGTITSALLDDDLDLADVLDQLVVASMTMLEVAAAAVVLDDQQGALVPVASSSEDSRLLELFQIKMDQGPCLDAIRDSSTVVSADLEKDRDRWPAFVEAALAVGYRSVVAVPMRIHDVTIGGLNLFGGEAAGMSAERQRLGQSLA